MCLYVCGCTDVDLSQWQPLSVCRFPAALQSKLLHHLPTAISSCSHQPQSPQILSANSLMTNKGIRVEKTSVYSCQLADTYAYCTSTSPHRNLSRVRDGNIVFMPFLSHFAAWEYTSLTQEKGNQFHAGNYLYTIFWQKL